jgi:D-glycero-D-manno-heptose 1,7-bisphosphate phosphatase
MISNIKSNSHGNSIKLIIFDRDGTLIENIPYLSNPNQVHLKPEVAPTLKEFQNLGFQMVVATNQSGIGRKFISESQVEKIHTEITKKLLEKGIILDEFIYCPHTPLNDCNCRKPKNGMIEEIISKKKVHRSNVVFVGDMLTDALAASKSSVKSILVSKDETLLTMLPNNCKLINNFEDLISIIKRDL